MAANVHDELADSMLAQAEAIAAGENVGLGGYLNWMIGDTDPHWWRELEGPDDEYGKHQRIVALCMGAAIMRDPDFRWIGSDRVNERRLIAAELDRKPLSAVTVQEPK